MDGFRIRSWESGPSRPVGAVVMLEGMTWGLSKLRDALVQKYRVITLELPGFGESLANTRSQSVQELANTVAQACARWCRKIIRHRHVVRCQCGTLADAAVAGQSGGPLVVAPTAILPAPAHHGPAGGTAKRLLLHPEKGRGYSLAHLHCQGAGAGTAAHRRDARCRGRTSAR